MDAEFLARAARDRRTECRFHLVADADILSDVARQTFIWFSCYAAMALIESTYHGTVSTQTVRPSPCGMSWPA
jgi:hypothetical protein